MTRKQKTVATITVVLGLGLLLAPFIPAWLFWHRIRQFEQAVGVSDAWYFTKSDDLLHLGKHIGIRYVGNPAFRQVLGDTLSGTFSEVNAVVIEEPTRNKLKALKFVDDTKRLHVKGPATDDCVGVIYPPLSRLEVLTFWETGLDDTALEEIASGNSLTSLSLVGAPAVSSEGLQRTASRNSIKALFLSGVPGIDGLFPEAEKTFDNLKTATLSGRQFGDATAAQLAKIKSLTLIQWTRGALTDDGVEQLTNCDSLRGLWIIDCPITDAAVDYLRGMPKLEELVLRADISDEAIEKFRAARPDCQLTAGRPFNK